MNKIFNLHCMLELKVVVLLGVTFASASCLEGQSITASPNPIIVASGSLGQTTIYAGASTSDPLGVYVGSPTGGLLTQGYNSLSATTGVWVTNGMGFYLVDQNTKQTLATTTVAVVQNTGGVADSTGCTFGPYSACIDPVPATFIGGSWIESDSASEWTLTANDGAPGASGHVSGTVLVFPPSGTNCPPINYTATGSYSPSQVVNGTEGSTSFSWTATGPNPSNPCGGYTPVASQTFSGTILNKGNDTATGTYSNSSGGSGPISLETNLVLTPTGESLSIDTSRNADYPGFGPVNTIFETELQVFQTLVDNNSFDPTDPHNNKFQGRQVYETPNGPPTDTCYAKAIAKGQTYTGGSYQIVGSAWNVGPNVSGNTYGTDSIGWPTEGVKFYRRVLSTSDFPCSATVPQSMNIINNISGFNNQVYATHSLTITLTLDDETVTKDNVSGTTGY